ncbi:hypothetical protein ASO20_02520 [Mycoplasma sp. (ex Biomphalaria glabrata)]|uniref:FtsX-like permease family protein n=1 Tax=Mycoplasma sp. (ex Biomphalaria glabrata) TaxID=1749074 RepID=UPI00073AB550|nr:ABC transporter permease [Mycoplasma sp. (ex Biomphalaria glabrata)]ALV23509.1 hypothetical protein ASO20_02520 [Mycoplasma sp. (ex Biomphalaria glabrata)]
MKRLLYKNSLLSIRRQKTFFLTIVILLSLLLTFIFSVQNFVNINNDNALDFIKQANIPQFGDSASYKYKESLDSQVDTLEKHENTIYKDWSITNHNSNNPTTNPLYTSLNALEDVDNQNNSNIQVGDHIFSSYTLFSTYNATFNSNHPNIGRLFQVNDNKTTFIDDNVVNDFNKLMPQNVSYSVEGQILHCDFSGETYVSYAFAKENNLKVGDTITLHHITGGQLKIFTTATLQVYGIANSFFNVYPTLSGTNFFVNSSRPSLILPFNYSFVQIPPSFKNWGTYNLIIPTLVQTTAFTNPISDSDLNSLISFANNLKPNPEKWGTIDSNSFYISTFLMKNFFLAYIIMGAAFVAILIIFIFLIIYGILKRMVASYKTQLALFKSMGASSMSIATSMTILPLISTFASIMVSILVAYFVQLQISSIFSKVFSFYFITLLNIKDIVTISLIAITLITIISYLISLIMCKKIKFTDTLYEGNLSKPYGFFWFFKKFGALFSINGMLTYNLFLKNFTKIVFSLVTIVFSFVCLLFTSIALTTVTSFVGEINAGTNMWYEYSTNSIFNSSSNILSPFLTCERDDNKISDCRYYNPNEIHPFDIKGIYTSEELKFDISSTNDAVDKIVKMLEVNEQVVNDITTDINGEKSTSIAQLLNDLPGTTPTFYYLDSTSTKSPQTWLELAQNLKTAINNPSTKLTPKHKTAVIAAVDNFIKSITSDVNNKKFYFGAEMLRRGEDSAVYAHYVGEAFNSSGSSIYGFNLMSINENDFNFNLYNSDDIKMLNSYENQPNLGFIPIFVNRSFLITSHLANGDMIKVMSSDGVNYYNMKIIGVLKNTSQTFAVTNDFFAQQFFKKEGASIRVTNSGDIDNFAYSFTANSSKSNSTFANYFSTVNKWPFLYSNPDSVMNISNIVLVLILLVGIIGFLLSLFSLMTVINIMIFQDIRYLSVMNVLGYKWNYSLKQIFIIYVFATAIIVGISIGALYKPVNNFFKNFENVNPLRFSIQMDSSAILLSVTLMVIIFLLIWIISTISLRKIDPLRILKEE